MDTKNTTDIYKVFSNENRVKLIACLSTPKSVTELRAHCKLSQSALSQHLSILKEGGVAVCNRDGKKQIYVIKNKKVLQVSRLLLDLSK
ncbi:MAG: metalloregulator ArsR/SmtB family transcription factor [Candidatus Paceibacterota bacterium]